MRPDYYDEDEPVYDPPDVTCLKCGGPVDPSQMFAHWCGSDEKPEEPA